MIVTINNFIKIPYKLSRMEWCFSCLKVKSLKLWEEVLYKSLSLMYCRFAELNFCGFILNEVFAGKTFAVPYV